MSGTSSRDPKVTTAVEFLNDVWKKGHKEDELRKYLITRLTKAQVNEAFRIHHIRLRGSAERPEKVSSAVKTSTVPTFLREGKRVVGEKLIKDFLRTEFNYLGVLRCLWDQYYKDLCVLSDNRKIDFRRADLKNIFHRISDLLDFHKVFFQNLSKDNSDIGQLFVHAFNHFKQYVDYMKDCTTMTVMMREHIHDKQLHRYLEQIRARSKRKNDDMVDLLLVPLDRIMDYQQFLDKLFVWADHAQSSHTYLGKAARRIGRIANYIGKYKGGISNKNEMNKVQQFLSRQCNILAPKRLIIRRGPMFRRTTGWRARRKHYIFFLFSDLLIWTTRKGELKNVVRLRDCEVMESDSKTNPELKFTIISTGKNRVRKELLLECSSKKQRDEWFKTVQQEVQSSKRTRSTEEIMTSSEKDFIKFLEMNPATIDTTPPPGSSNIVEETKGEDDKFSSNVGEDDIPVPGGPNWRYQSSADFPKMEFFEEFSHLDDTVSVSEDLEPYAFMQNYEKYGESMDGLFPNMVSSRSKLEESKETLGEGDDRLFAQKEDTFRRSPQAVISPGSTCRSNSTSLSIIRRADEIGPSKERVNELENKSAFTFRLNDFQ